MDQEETTVHRAGLYGWAPGVNGPNRFRIAEPVRAYRALGGRAETGPLLDDLILSRCDTVLAHCLHDEQSTEAWQKLSALQSHRLILDIDDLMWDPDYEPFRRHYDAATLERLADNIAAAHVVTTTTAYLAQRITEWTGHRNVHVLPNTVPAWLLDHDMPAREHPTIGWQGSPSHAPDWGTTGQHLVKFLAVHDDWRVRFYGPEVQHPHPQIECIPWIKDVDTYWRTLSIDVGIGPLRDTRFNRAKSALRAVEYAALGIVAVLPDLPTYQGWVFDGLTGLLVRSHQTLRGQLHRLANEPGWLQHMSRNARLVARDWTTEANIQQWIRAWNTV